MKASIESVRDLNFEKIIQSLPEFKTLIFQHGERLFIKRDGEYEVLAVRVAYRIHCMAVMDRMCIHEWEKILSLSGRWGGALVKRENLKCKLCGEIKSC